ncbi:hypothetical protein H4Q26_014365 [Puccinia striiformis f. sp. tritici PST-130]|nr:hypothetical protein H4Q26_014365 [Puccinia striiformis f. sp. tritici PST-130]
MSWNVNGIKMKLPMLKQLLQENNVSVAGVQEHLRTVCQYAPGVKNYNIFERPSEKGFRGHCLYVHNSLAAHEIQSTCKHLIYVKIFGLSGEKPWHIFSVYMPSGNLQRRDRAEVWSQLKALLLPLQKDGGSLITLMGNFNQDKETVSRILDQGNIRCLHLKLTSDPSSNSTRRVHEEEGRYIDHFINSPAALKCASTAKVDNISTDLSDHWPIFLNHNTISKDTIRTRKVWNRKLIAGHGMELALSDRWSCLSTEDINTEEDLTNAASKWVEILNATGEELGLLSVPKEQQTQHFDRANILKEGTIQTVPTYKYLGCLIPNTVLPEDPYPVETGHAKLLAKKAENTMHMSLPILYDKDLHPLTKARVIQSYIMAVGSYEAEWIAMCQKRTRTIQVVLDKASKICFGLKEANKPVNTLLLSLELGVTPLSIHCTLQRIRLWNKGPKLGTLLKDLIKFPHPGKEGTWASNTLTNIKKLTNQESTLKEDDEEGDPLATHHTLTWIASMRKNRLDLHPKHPSPIGTNERVSPEQKEQLAQLETFHVTLLEKEVRQEAKKSQSVARYDRYELGRSANFVSTSINIPDITRGIHYLCLLRMNALPSLSRRIQALTAQKINHTLKKGICPCCKANAVDSGPEEWCHILLTCLFFRDIRDATIGGTVLYLIEKIWEIPRDMEDQHIYVLLMGGLLQTHIKENPREKSVEETEYESPALTTWVNGYGHIPHLYPA